MAAGWRRIGGGSASGRSFWQRANASDPEFPLRTGGSSHGRAFPSLHSGLDPVCERSQHVAFHAGTTTEPTRVAFAGPGRLPPTILAAHFRRHANAEPPWPTNRIQPRVKRRTGAHRPSHPHAEREPGVARFHGRGIRHHHAFAGPGRLPPTILAAHFRWHAIPASPETSVSDSRGRSPGSPVIAAANQARKNDSGRAAHRAARPLV